MQLSKLVEHIEYELVQGSLDTEVADIAYDSRKMKEGMLFVAIAGTVVDGHKYIPDVVKKGASVLVVEKEIESIDESITVIFRVHTASFSIKAAEANNQKIA